MEDLFDPAAHARLATEDAQPQLAAERERILVFDVVVRGARETAWQDLFEGFRSLKVITFSASVPAILDVARLFEDVEITFGSERVLSRELAALAQATTAASYRFVDALADQKTFIERLVRPALSRRGTQLLERVQDGTLRFRLLRQAPSHAKLYLLAGDSRLRAVAGSAISALRLSPAGSRRRFSSLTARQTTCAFWSTTPRTKRAPIRSTPLFWW